MARMPQPPELARHQLFRGPAEVDADTAGDRIGNRLRVSGDHRDPDTKLMKLCYRLL
jgi:hypothetical protein